jgi:hypothetical protein
MKFFTAFFLLVVSFSASAQNLTVISIDSSNFPTMKAQIYATDANNILQSPSPSEITASEDGIPRKVTSISCSQKTFAPFSLGLMFDTHSGRDIARAAVQKFLSFLPLPPSEAGMTVMENGAYIMQDFTQKRAKLLTAVSSVPFSQTTDLERVFYGGVMGGVPFVSGRPNKKTLILITDLHCPMYNLDKVKLFSDCLNNQIAVYIVLINANDHYGYFQDIADHTGGVLFQGVNTVQSADQVFLKISNDIGTVPPCEITWESEGSCAPDIKHVSFAWNSATATETYHIPNDRVAQLQASPTTLYIFGKQQGIKFDTTISITAVSSDFSITNIVSSNPLYTISPTSFSLARGATKTLTISYTPPDSSYTWTDFSVFTDKCTKLFYASTSYPGKSSGTPTAPSIKLSSPNGRETYDSGSDTLITWTGVPPADTVSLSYSLDSGKSWTVITTQATGGSYLWHLPQKTSTKCLVNVTQFVRSANNFVIRCGGTGSSVEAKGVVTDNEGNIYVTGAADGNTDFGGIALTSNVGRQAFLAKYSSAGSLLWVTYLFSIYTEGSSAGNSIALDPSGNILVTGTAIGEGPFVFNGKDTISPLGPYNIVNIFTTKFYPDGSPGWMQLHRGPESGGYEEGLGVVSDESGNVFVTGYFGDSTKFGNTYLKVNHYWDIFIAKYLSDGTLDWVHTAGNLDFDKGNSIAVDKAGFAYITGSFEDKGIFDGIQVNNAGGWDAFIAKYNPDGSIGWVKSYGGPSTDEGRGITIDQFGYIYVTGDFGGTANFGGQTITAKGSTDLFVAKFLPDGTLVWIEQAGNANSSADGNGITTDPLGNIYVTGFFTGTMNFGSQSLTSSGGIDIFIAKYASDGTFQWAKRGGGTTGDDEGDAVTVDRFGNVYCTGYTRNDGDFSGLPSTHKGTGFQDLFIWKFGTESPLQSDASDTVFSIIAPIFSFSVNTIDMGQVTAGDIKDSVVKATICNSGTTPLHVLSMDVTGGATTEFMITSGAGDFTLAPGECRDVLFTFMPMMAGKMSATVTLKTASGNYPDTIKIIGEGIAPIVQVLSSAIDFGQVAVGGVKDTVVMVAIHNIGNSPLNFTSSSQLGPDIKQFSILSGDVPFTLNPGASQTFTFRFTSKYIGRATGRISFDYGAANPAILSLFGQGLGGLVLIKDDSGYAGDKRNIPLVLQNVPASSVQSSITNYSARITYNRTDLYSSGGLIQSGNLYDTVTMKGSLQPDNSLGSVPFTVLLGENIKSPLNIVDFSWLDDSGQPLDFDVDTKSGTFTLLGICPAGGNRLYDPNGQVSMAHVTPNPSNGMIHIDIQTTESGRTQLAVMNLLGVQVAVISDGELKTGMHSFDFNTNGLAAGSYFLLLQTPTVRRLERIDVEK